MGLHSSTTTLQSLMAEYGEILDVKDPDCLSQTERDSICAKRRRTVTSVLTSTYATPVRQCRGDPGLFGAGGPIQILRLARPTLSSRLTVDTKSELLAFSAEEQVDARPPQEEGDRAARQPSTFVHLASRTSSMATALQPPCPVRTVSRPAGLWPSFGLCPLWVA